MNALPRIWDIPILLFLSMVWASSFTMIKVAVPELGPVGIVFIRCFIGALFMLMLVLASGRKKGQKSGQKSGQGAETVSVWPTTWREWILLSVVGVTSTALPFYLISFAEQKISSSMTAILMTTGPLAVIILGHIFTEDEKINRGKLVGIMIGFAAALYLLRGGLSGFGNVGGGMSIYYPLAAMAAAVCYAVGGLLAKKMVNVSAEVIAFYVLAISAVVVAPFYLTGDSPSLMAVSSSTFWAVIWLGVMPSGFAFYLRYFLIKRNGYGFVSYVGYLIPLCTIGIGMLTLDEKVTFDTFMAMMVILMGLIFTRSHDDFPWSTHPKLETFRKTLN